LYAGGSVPYRPRHLSLSAFYGMSWSSVSCLSTVVSMRSPFRQRSTAGGRVSPGQPRQLSREISLFFRPARARLRSRSRPAARMLAASSRRSASVICSGSLFPVMALGPPFPGVLPPSCLPTGYLPETAEKRRIPGQLPPVWAPFTEASTLGYYLSWLGGSMMHVRPLGRLLAGHRGTPAGPERRMGVSYDLVLYAPGQRKLPVSWEDVAAQLRQHFSNVSESRTEQRAILRESYREFTTVAGWSESEAENDTAEESVSPKAGEHITVALPAWADVCAVQFALSVAVRLGESLGLSIYDPQTDRDNLTREDHESVEGGFRKYVGDVEQAAAELNMSLPTLEALRSGESLAESGFVLRPWEVHSRPECAAHLSNEETIEALHWWYTWAAELSPEDREFQEEENASPYLEDSAYWLVSSWIATWVGWMGFSSAKFLAAAKAYWVWAHVSPDVHTPEGVFDIDDEDDSPTDEDKKTLRGALEAFHALRVEMYRARGLEKIKEREAAEKKERVSKTVGSEHSGWQNLKEWVAEIRAHNGATMAGVYREADGQELASVFHSLVVEARKAWATVAPLWRDAGEEDEVTSRECLKVAEACTTSCWRTFRSMLEAEAWLVKSHGPSKADELLDLAADALWGIWEAMMECSTSPQRLSVAKAGGEDAAPSPTKLEQCEDAFRRSCEELHLVAAQVRASASAPVLRDEGGADECAAATGERHRAHPYTIVDAIRYLDHFEDPLAIERVIGIQICAEEVSKSFAFFAAAGGSESLPTSHEFFLNRLADWVKPFGQLPNGFMERTKWFSPRMAMALGKMRDLIPGLLRSSRDNVSKITPIDGKIVRDLGRAVVILDSEMRPGKPDAQSLSTEFEAANESNEAAIGDTQRPRVAEELIDGMRTFLMAHPGEVFTAKKLNQRMHEAGHTSKDYPAQDISNVKRYLRDVEDLPLVGRRYCYKPVLSGPD